MNKKLLFLSFVADLVMSIGISFGQGYAVDHWESVVYAGDTWRYYVNFGQNPQAGWQNPEFTDTSWLQGPGGFGYADGDDLTSISIPPFPKAVCIRTDFEILDTSQLALAVLNMDYDDGFVAWINGTEIARANMGNPGDDAMITNPPIDHEALMYHGGVPPSFIISKRKLKDCIKNGRNILAVQVNNFGASSSDMSCIPYLSLGLINETLSYRPVPDWFEEPFIGFMESHLPLVMIRTNGAVISSEVKVMVDFGIIDNGPGVMNHADDEWNSFKGQAGIEYRGSSSMGFPKKNYGIETRTITGADSAVSLLGLPVEADWVLHGPYSDKSLVRNRLAYDLAREMGHYAPRAKFCELFLDDQYQGAYVLIEKIKRDSNRVNIARLDSTDLIGFDLTGGYIIKIDRSADGSYADGWYSPYRGSGSGGMGPFFAWHYPKWEDIQPLQMNYIRNKITRFEDALFGPDFRNPGIGYRSYIDVNSFIDYFILVELSKNVDGYRLSTFLHKDRDDVDPLIHMGPVWDYDLAFGNADYYQASVISQWNYPVIADGWGTPYWWSRFMLDPFFVNKLNCRWHSLRQSVLSDASLTSFIDAYVDSLGDASDRNFIQWPIHGIYIWPNAFVGNSFTEDINFMKTWILGRADWLDKSISGECTVDTDLPEEFTFSVTVRPNPSVGMIHLEIQNPLAQNLSIEIVNIAGSVVFREIADNDPLIYHKIVLQPGLYMVRAICGSEIQTIKVIVK